MVPADRSARRGLARRLPKSGTRQSTWCFLIRGLLERKVLPVLSLANQSRSKLGGFGKAGTNPVTFSLRDVKDEELG